MAAHNLLDLVNSILEPLNEGSVDTIDETEASLQVARIFRDTYEEGLANRNWGHKKVLVVLPPYGISTPTHLIIPGNVKEIISVKYDVARITDTRRRFQEIVYKDPVDFLDFTNSRNSSSTNVIEVTDPSGTPILIKDDIAPSFFTSFNQKTIIMDSYDKEVGTTLQEAKQQVYVVSSSEFTLQDDFIPDLPEEAFPWLLAEAKSVAFVDMAQESNVKAEQKAHRQNQWLSRKNRAVGGGIQIPRFGRKGKR